MDYNSNGISVGVVAVAIAVIALGFSIFGGSSQPSQNVGGERAGLQEFMDGIKLGPVTEQWATVSLSAGVNQASWRNNQVGKDIVVDYAEFDNGTGVASTTYQFFIATSSAATISSDFDDPFSPILDGYTLATSSKISVINSIKDAGTNGRSAAKVSNGEYVIFTFQQRYAGNCSGSVCETATSTNRGFNSTGRLKFHY